MFVRRSIITVTKQSRNYGSYSSKRALASFPLVFGGASLIASAIFVKENNSHCDGWWPFSAHRIEIKDVKADIVKIIEDIDEKRGDGTGIGPTFVRLAWHASGTYSAADKTGGSNGATMRFPPEATWGANAGLQSARDALEPIKKKYHSLSYADIWTLAGVVAIESMGGPTIPWRTGRNDSSTPTKVPDGRLPGADKGSSPATRQHIRDIFYRMGFNDQEIVALLGAHALGRCHTNASGYWGPWTRAETTFSNEYFRLLLEEKWTEKKTHEGKKWTGPLQYESPDGKLMMLPSDLALIQDPAFKKYVDIYAKDETVFFNDFAVAFSKLLELGVSFPKH